MPLSPALQERLKAAFRPHAPIEDPDSFIGRPAERAAVMDAIEQPGLQVLVFGERGAGKTSLANVCTARHRRIRVFCEKDADFPRLARDVVLAYQALDPERVVYDVASDTVRVEGTSIPLGKISGNLLRRVLPTTGELCIVLDELDRVEDKNAIAHLAELAKNLSTYQTNITLVLVGVAGTADELLAGHTSNFRNLRQVSLDRMARNELIEIIRHGEKVLELDFQPAIETKIVELCDRFPYYLHLLATASAKAALERDAKSVSEADLLAGIKEAATGADQTLRQSYDHAILSVKRSEIYRLGLWALASLAGNSHTVAEIADKLNQFAEQEGGSAVTVQSVGQALKKLAGHDKGRILTQRAAGIYGFGNPLMKGFVRLVMEQR